MSINIYKNGALQTVAGSSIMDAQLDSNSTNGVQNKVVTAAINQINQQLTATYDPTTKKWYELVNGQRGSEIKMTRYLDYDNAVIVTGTNPSGGNNLPITSDGVIVALQSSGYWDYVLLNDKLRFNPDGGHLTLPVTSTDTCKFASSHSGYSVSMMFIPYK